MGNEALATYIKGGESPSICSDAGVNTHTSLGSVSFFSLCNTLHIDTFSTPFISVCFVAHSVLHTDARL